MTQAPADPPDALATAAAIMRPALTTVEANGHLAAAAYLMKHASATALVVVDDEQTKHPTGLITDADIAQAVADARDMNDARVHDIMTTHLTTVPAATPIRDAAAIMIAGHFRHLPVVGDTGLIGMLDIADVCQALLNQPTG